jgi:hypothetical protein
MLVDNVSLFHEDGLKDKFKIGGIIKPENNESESQIADFIIEKMIIEDNILKVFLKGSEAKMWYPINRYYIIIFKEVEEKMLELG